MHLDIREMTPRDIPRVCELLRDCYEWLAHREGFTAGQLAFLVDHRSSERIVGDESKTRPHLVACRNGSTLGMAVVRCNEVARLYVDPRYHRQGVGRTLFEASEAMIRRAGFREVLVAALVDSATAFYRAMGMAAIARQEYAPGLFDGREVILMMKHLAGPTAVSPVVPIPT
jgi:ribosomal protein S18 acetylase RimI-like enzyme